MQYSISIYFLYFIILAIIGWIMEVTLQLVQKHKFSNRGFLIGPYCPIYGCGGVLITLTLSNLAYLWCTRILNKLFNGKNI